MHAGAAYPSEGIMSRLQKIRFWKICQRETGHWPIANGQVRDSMTPLEGAATSFQTFQVVQCRECGSTTYCIDIHIHPGPMMGDSYTQSTLYHPPLPFRLTPGWYHELPEFYRHILDS